MSNTKKNSFSKTSEIYNMRYIRSFGAIDIRAREHSICGTAACQRQVLVCVTSSIALVMIELHHNIERTKLRANYLHRYEIRFTGGRVALTIWNQVSRHSTGKRQRAIIYSNNIVYSVISSSLYCHSPVVCASRHYIIRHT